jgi:hypothetical protein
VDPEIFIATIVLLIVVPVTLGVGTTLFSRWMKHREVMAQALGHQSVQNAAANAVKLDRLEKRMAVMERILTDRSTRLGEEIERLRDAPVN